MDMVWNVMQYYKQMFMDIPNCIQSMECRKHVNKVPMIEVMIDFMGHKITVGHYCLLCYNFVNKTNPEAEILRNILIKNLSNDAEILTA